MKRLEETKPVELFTVAEVASVIKCSVYWIYAARKTTKREPMPFTHGNVTLLEPVLDWVARNRDFRMKEVYPRKDCAGAPKRPAARIRKSVDRRGEQLSRSVEQGS